MILRTYLITKQISLILVRYVIHFKATVNWIAGLFKKLEYYVTDIFCTKCIIRQNLKKLSHLMNI